MTETVDCIIPLSEGRFFFLQSTHNAIDPQTELPMADAGNYYVGYPCHGDGGQAQNYHADRAPLSGHQPGQVYPTADIASIENAAEALDQSI